jgi:hypothetical protein
MKDSIVEAVRQDLFDRSELGIKKYGTTLDRTDLQLKDWLQHAYEESLDHALYLKRAIKEIETIENGNLKKCTNCGTFAVKTYDGYWCKLCKLEM